MLLIHLINKKKNKQAFLFRFFILSNQLFCILDATGNNHDATELQEVVPATDDEGGDEDSGFKVKERSILQAKLTKLAIQIGYAGKEDLIFNQYYLFWRVLSREFIIELKN